MNDNIITGVINNIDTGEKTEMEHYALFPHYKMTAIVLVKEAKAYETKHNDDRETHITVQCKALDSFGNVFNMEIFFIPETMDEKTAILSEMIVDSLHIVEGCYISENNGPICIVDPEYHSIEPDFNEDEIREAFRINEKHKRCQ